MNADGRAGSANEAGDGATERAIVAQLFAGPGEMRARCRALDWGATPLGPVGAWPQSLRTAVQLCLASGFPMLVMWGPELVQVYNDAFRAVLQAKHPAGLGQRARDCWPELWSMIEPMYRSVLDTGVSIFTEDQLFTPQRRGEPGLSEEAYFTFSYSAIPDESHRPAGILATTIETTRHVLSRDERERALERANAALRAAASEREQLLVASEEARRVADDLRARARSSEALTRQLFALSPVPKWVYDAETLAFLDVNEAAMRHYGYTREEFLAMTIRDIRPPEDVQRMLVHARAAHPTGASQGIFRHRKRTGELMDVEVFLRDVHYEGRRAVIAVVQDVTERVRADAALRDAWHAAALARDAAEAANAAKSQFLSTMSHELRTPLNAIGGYTDLLIMGIRGPLTDAQLQDLERVRLASRHLMALVTDVLNFARLDAGQLEYRVRDVELATIVADLESLIRPQLDAKSIAFDHDACAPDTPEHPHLVRADPEKLRQILLNLLSNAVKFTDAGGRVSIACETDHEGGAIHVRVRDTGRGIAAEQLDRIFEPFVQVDRHRLPESQQGVGLGLAISRELARAMHGDITVMSAPGAGSTFTLTLPCA